MARRGPPTKNRRRIKELCVPIRKAMDDLDLGPTKLQKMTGIPKQSISQYYNCKSLPSFHNLNVLYGTLGIQEVLIKGVAVTTTGVERGRGPQPVVTQAKLIFEELKQQRPRIEVVRVKGGFELRIPIKMVS